MTQWLKSVTIMMLLTTSIALAAGSETTTTSAPESMSSYDEAVTLIENSNYQEAADILLVLAEDEPENADVFNWLGYSHRKMEAYDVALEYYMTALELEPMHLGANSYLGELYVETGQMEKAQAQLDILAEAEACGGTCDEYNDLLTFIETGSSW
ncbi:MAG: tetratricopeptide repeat protein [Deinococcota bacterium]